MCSVYSVFRGCVQYFFQNKIILTLNQRYISRCSCFHLYAPAPLSSGCTVLGSMLGHWGVVFRYSLFTQFFRLSGMRPMRKTELCASVRHKYLLLMLSSDRLLYIECFWYHTIHRYPRRDTVPVMARRTSLAASSLASTEACSLYQDVWGVQIRFGASFRGPWEKLHRKIIP